jgi:hypothetical protein
MRSLRGFVFVESRKAVREHLLAVTSPAVVRWCLARRYPWLELAYARATADAIGLVVPPPDPRDFVANGPIVTTEHGALSGGGAARVAREFLSSLQEWSGNPRGLGSPEWVELTGYRERAAWVTPNLLRELLPAEAFGEHMPEMRDEPQSKRVRALLRRQGEVIALVNSSGQFKRLVDRSALLEEAAAQLSREPA